MNHAIVIDFETANGSPSSVCSVGIVIVRDGEVVDSFYGLHYPGSRFLDTVAAACGYSLLNHHHALADAEASAAIALKLL